MTPYNRFLVFAFLFGLCFSFFSCSDDADGELSINENWQCGDPFTYQGYDYATVQIGGQCWFAENLRSKKYANGDAIPSNQNTNEWLHTPRGATAVYGEGDNWCRSFNPDGDGCDEAWSLNEIGRLYNWYAVDDARGLCPSGWHEPTDVEWTEMTDYLGGSSFAGTKMKTDYGWSEGGNGTNASGFSGLPGGYRGANAGGFDDSGNDGRWWSSSQDGYEALSRLLNSEKGVIRRSDDRRVGLSVRCVRDAKKESSLKEGVNWKCGDPVNYQGYDYATVQIGNQCWYAENLRSENYANGDAIPAGLSDSDWESATSGAMAVYGEYEGCSNYSPDIDACDPSQSLDEYGRLYNWYAVDDARGLCPSGWHVPTDGEWMTMEMTLGMTEVEAYSTGWRGTNQGAQMKTAKGWARSGNGTNSRGFSGFPGGLRSYDGTFYLAGANGFWWSSSPYGSDAWSRNLDGGIDDVYRVATNPRWGKSVRCIKTLNDEPLPRVTPPRRVENPAQ